HRHEMPGTSPQGFGSGAPSSTLSLPAGEYVQTTNRNLDGYDDSEWWSMGGSYGQVGSGSGGSGCGTRVCPNSGVNPSPSPTPNGKHPQFALRSTMTIGTPFMQ